MKKYGLFYGTLRENESNFNRFDGQTPIKTLTLKGYDLYGPFPRLYKGKGQVVVELHALSDYADDSIRQMELGASYKEVKVKVDDVEASLYISDVPIKYLKESRWNVHIKSGDWVKWAKSFS